LGTGCFSVKAFTVNPNPASITGTNFVCDGQTTPLADATSGGTYTSSNPALATIGSVTGIATGIIPGVLTITYTISATGCFTSTPFTVNPNTSNHIGATSICQGLTTTLTNAAGGGTWSSSNPAAGTINSTTGVVTGIAGGTTTINYTLPTGCIASVGASSFTVNPTPANIGGTLTVCPGTTSTLTDASAGGTWVSNNTAVATMAGAVATGVATGTSTITYTLPTGCFTTAVLTVNPNPEQ
jgi:uncharacterized protein YjdB